jgi:hypothetical protein
MTAKEKALLKMIGIRLTSADINTIREMALDAGFYNVSDYIRGIIREYRKAKSQRQLFDLSIEKEVK